MGWRHSSVTQDLNILPCVIYGDAFAGRNGNESNMSSENWFKKTLLSIPNALTNTLKLLAACDAKQY